MPTGRHIAARSLLLAALLTAVSGANPATGWKSDFAAARAEAVRLDRPLLVHFYADWCGPCKRMDREVLHTPEFVARASRRVVAVKIDVERHRDVAERYGVDSLPTDLFLAPDGRVLGMMNGYRPKDDYFRRVVAIESQYDRLRDLYLARSDGKAPVRATTDGAGPRFPVLDRPELDSPSEPAPDAPKPGIRLKPRADGTLLLGLKGYSPVALHDRRQWLKGNPRFAWEHQGLTYFMGSAEELAKFQDDAERYAPRLLGCDPVLYYDEGRAVPGSTSFAALFDEGLFLFTSRETREAFRASPDRYTRRRTVLLIEECEAVLR
ncbi:MAG: thioredoxin family protein [Planctomycetaceae bacterium]